MDGNFKGKVLIAIIEDGKEAVFNNLLSSLKKEKHVKLIHSYSESGLLQYNSIEINPKARTVIRDGVKIELTQYEFEILYLLAKYPGEVFSKKQIYEQVWETPYFGAENSVVSLIYRIRKKIEPNLKRPVYILTVWGIGYKFNDALDLEDR